MRGPCGLSVAAPSVAEATGGAAQCPSGPGSPLTLVSTDVKKSLTARTGVRHRRAASDTRFGFSKLRLGREAREVDVGRVCDCVADLERRIEGVAGVRERLVVADHQASRDRRVFHVGAR